MKQFYIFIFCLFSTIAMAQSTGSMGSDIEGLKLYPNPVTNGVVHITTQKNAPKTILIYDLFGTKLMETKILGKELNIGRLDAGVYMIRIFEKDKIATRKLIVK